MSRFKPVDFAEAKEVADSRVRKPRTSLAREKGLRVGQSGSGPSRAKSASLGCATASRRKVKAKKPKKKTDGQLKKLAWKQFSIFIRTRGADENGFNRCVTCAGGPWHWKDLQAGHFLRGRLNANLFTEVGVNPQCYGCNVGRDGNVVEYYIWMLANHGQSVIDDLRARNNITHKWAPGELIDLLAKYKALNEANPLTKVNQ